MWGVTAFTSPSVQFPASFPAIDSLCLENRQFRVLIGTYFNRQESQSLHTSGAVDLIILTDFFIPLWLLFFRNETWIEQGRFSASRPRGLVQLEVGSLAGSAEKGTSTATTRPPTWLHKRVPLLSDIQPISVSVSAEPEAVSVTMQCRGAGSTGKQCIGEAETATPENDHIANDHTTLTPFCSGFLTRAA